MLTIVLLALCGCSSESPKEPPRTPLKDALFRSTHNSYSGEERGTIPAQLEAGVRFIEFDVYVDGDGFALGHDGPGDEVAVGDGNPDTSALGPWIDVVAAWSDAHPDHALLTLGLDVKGDLDEATVAKLEDAFESAFGEKLLRPGEVDANTIAETLSGRVLLILSGNLALRRRYGFGGETFFAEYQDGNPADMEAATFWAASSLKYMNTTAWEDKDVVVRLWALDFDVILDAVSVTYPATDTPFADWYETYCQEHGALK